MERASRLKKDWVLTQDAFDLLLTRLDRDQERAGQRYEEIRQALITFFECRGSTRPEDHADETINRVARKLIEGTAIHSENPAGYFYGVARNLLKEYWDSSERSVAALDDGLSGRVCAEDGPDIADGDSERLRGERQLECLEDCLGALAHADRDLIGRYYVGEAGIKIQNRKSLAGELRIPLNALRIRALRIREKLEACVERCVARSRET